MTAQLEKTIADLTIALDKAQAELKAHKESEWPKDGDRYYFLHYDGTIAHESWEGERIDKDIASIGNIYRTEAEAAREVERRKLIVELKAHASKCNGDWVPDWKDGKFSKHIFFLHSANKWCGDCVSASQYYPDWRCYRYSSDRDSAIALFGDRLSLLLEE